MKYIKTYESDIFTKDPTIGDYVIARSYYFDISTPTTEQAELETFFSTNVGQIIKFGFDNNAFKFVVRYDNVPKNIQKFFHSPEGMSETYYLYGFRKNDIIMCSKDINDLESHLASKKYNL